MATVVAQLKAILGLDTGPYSKGMKQAVSQAQSFRSAFSGVMSGLGAGFSVGAIVSLGKEAVNVGFQIEKMSKQFRVGSMEYQALADAIEDSGGDSDQLVQAFTKIIDAQGQVAGGNEKISKTLAQAGIDAQAFASAGTADALEMIANAGAAASWKGEEFSAIIDILGMRNVPQLQLALQELASKGLKNLTDEFASSAEAISSQASKTGENLKLFYKNVWDSIVAGASETMNVIAELGRAPARGFGVGDVEELSPADATRIVKATKAKKDAADAEKARKKSMIAQPETTGELSKARTAEDQLDEQLRAERQKRLTDEEQLTAATQERLRLEQLAADSTMDAIGTKKMELEIAKAITAEMALRQRLDDKAARAKQEETDLRERLAGALRGERRSAFNSFGDLGDEASRLGGMIGPSRAEGLRAASTASTDVQILRVQQASLAELQDISRAMNGGNI